MFDLSPTLQRHFLGPKGFPYWSKAALGIMNFSSGKNTLYTQIPRGECEYFDISSLTKPLVLGMYFLQLPQGASKSEQALLEHRGGIPSWGLLPKEEKEWKKILRGLKQRETQNTVYSDFSYLKLQTELEDLHENKSVKDLTREYWQTCAEHWLDLNEENKFQVQVQDPNAYNLKTFLAHAGLFTTIEKLTSGLQLLNKKNQFIQKFSKKASNLQTRFCYGWDTVGKNNPNSLAGYNAPSYIFGHLGFTGCSMWIDPVKNIGYAYLTNAKKYYYNDPYLLNIHRRQIGQWVFQK